MPINGKTADQMRDEFYEALRREQEERLAAARRFEEEMRQREIEHPEQQGAPAGGGEGGGMKKEFRQVWSQLRAKWWGSSEFLEQVTIRNLRGIPELTVSFAYPVTVLAGPNCCGKSTVLAAMACAYRAPQGSIRPNGIFPTFEPPEGMFPPADGSGESATIGYHYRIGGGLREMQWSGEFPEVSIGPPRIYGKPPPYPMGEWVMEGTRRTRERQWSQVFPSGSDASQPERETWYRSLPEIAAFPDVPRLALLGTPEDIHFDEIDPAVIRFAERIFPFCHRRLVGVTERMWRGRRDAPQIRDMKPLLFAVRATSGGGEPERGYSEFHMSSGERAILQMSMEIAQLHNALVLVDEVEFGLHPYTQKRVMLELQRLALRNSLQIVVATHSPTVLESVPKEARLFLERDESGARIVPPYRDIVQNALYGRTTEALSVLCEDKVAKHLIRGVFDALAPRLKLRHADLRIKGRASVSEFKHSLKTLQMFALAENFIFVLDGDSDARKAAKSLRDEDGQPKGGLLEVLNLPGEHGPEEWIWLALKRDSRLYAKSFAIDEKTFADMMGETERLHSTDTGRKQDIVKNRLHSLCNDIRREMTAVAREVGRREAEKEEGEMFEVAKKIHHAISIWRTDRE